VHVGEIDEVGIHETRDQLWAEAVHDYREWFTNNPGSLTRPWVLTDAESAEMDARTSQDNTVGDVWDDGVAKFLYSPMQDGWASNCMTDREAWDNPNDPMNLKAPRPLTSALALSLGIGIRTKDQNQGNARRLANIMRTLGWVLKPARYEGKLVKSWHPDTKAAKAAWAKAVSDSKGGTGHNPKLSEQEMIDALLA